MKYFCPQCNCENSIHDSTYGKCTRCGLDMDKFSEIIIRSVAEIFFDGDLNAVRIDLPTLQKQSDQGNQEKN
jgi:hypothetical protein